MWEGQIGTGAAGMLQFLPRKGVLPRTLPVLTALGDLDGVRACFSPSGALSAAAAGDGAGELATAHQMNMAGDVISPYLC